MLVPVPVPELNPGSGPDPWPGSVAGGQRAQPVPERWLKPGPVLR
ncbi:hypothetical protein Slala03_68830 [Streptomyces lavendulae subsp. lavendulae]|nr:hypothetical protein Slala03_68830 [Streptomyces lavendulae subsp. lavendulae]